MTASFFVCGARPGYDLDEFLEFEQPVVSKLEFPHINASGRLPFIFEHVKERDGTFTVAQKVDGKVQVHYGFTYEQLGNALRIQESFDLDVSDALDVEAVEELLDRDLSC